MQLAPHPPSLAIPPAAADHFARFYEEDAVLVGDVARYLRNALESGAAAISIATPAHASGVMALWEGEGFECAPCRERGQLIVLDAAKTLQKFMVGGRPDPAKFDEVIGAVVRERLGRFGELVAFGEMVALLWSAGQQAAAVELENLWNELAARHRFALYCAYPMDSCAGAEFSDAFRHVCRAHSHVIPTEGFRAGASEGEQLKTVAQLQQRAASLEREIGLRQELQRKLAERERELSDFVDNAAVGLHRVGRDGTILWANRAELEMLGYTASEYIGRNIAEFHADSDLIAHILATLSRGESLHDQPSRMLCKDGSIRHVLINSNALMEDGKFVSTRCFTRDVSDRWLAQEALRERGAVLHLAMQGARMGYWVADLSSGDLRFSHELEDLFGVSGASDWSLDAFLGLIHPEDRATFQSELHGAIAERRRLACDFRVRPQGSDWRWFEVRGEAIYGAAAQALRFYGVCMDVTARKREQQLLAHLAAVVESADDAIVSKTLDGIITSWNGGARRLFGYGAEEIIGQPITVLIPADMHDEEKAIIAKIRSGERIEHFVTTRVAKDGTRKRVSLSVSPVRDASGLIVGASKIAREITTPA